MNGVILVVLDGLGVALPGPGNAYFLANPTRLNSYLSTYPNTQLKASGEAVGLPESEVGSTEVGHINLGAGRIVYQSLPRINLSIADGSFFKNESFLQAIKHVKANGGKLHLMGLLGGGSVHSSTSHLHALLFLCKENGLKEVYIHVITDGRDSPPKAALTYLDDLQNKIIQLGVGKIVSVTGRYFAMDRDNRWDRVEKAYNALTKGTGEKALTWHDAVEKAYQQSKSDEFIKPTHIVEENKEPDIIQENDAVIFYNYRIDRPRELTKAFVLENFEQDANKKSFDPYTIKYYSKHETEVDTQTPPFQRGEKIKNLFFVMMTEYERDLPAAIAYPPHAVQLPLGRVLSERGMQQLRMAESEKERFVTYYFNGLREAAFPLEERIIIPSPKIATYDLKPEMSASELTTSLVEKINTQLFKFILVNYANADMVGHTGNLQAAIKAVEVIDSCIDLVVKTALLNDYAVLITADHGNVEEMIDTKTAGVSTEHSGNLAPFIAIEKNLKGKSAQLPMGILADVAPTILSLLNIPKPSEMSGRNLLEGVIISNSQLA